MTGTDTYSYLSVINQQIINVNFVSKARKLMYRGYATINSIKIRQIWYEKFLLVRYEQYKSILLNTIIEIFPVCSLIVSATSLPTVFDEM